MAKRHGAGADRRPNAPADRLQAEPVFVAGPNLDGPIGMRARLVFDRFGELFLKAASCSGVAAFGILGRGACTDQPIFFRASQPRGA